FRGHHDDAALAAALHLSPAALADALAPLPGRRPLAPPYYYATVTHGVLTTQGGAAIDTSGRVLRGDGTPIPGLRAGGGAAVGLAGPDSAGYSSGNGLLSALGMGWIIGNALRDGGTTS
ncbi:MAG: FAD-binding protein, partial [Streptosporangiales bacterium]|nr:FAD-binding protein [Streptosporangiales bacterium]